MPDIEFELLRRRVLDLEAELESIRELLQQFSTFGPLVVDLRLKGVVQPVCLFAREVATPANPTPFTIVPK